MKNFFDLAPNELTQDGFLAWFIGLADTSDEIKTDKESYYASRKFIKELTGIEDKITRIIINRQYSPNKKNRIDPNDKSRIDLAIRLFTKKQKIGLFIEDKVNTEESNNQLERYNPIIEYCKTHWGLDKVIKIFYKTVSSNREEQKRVKKAEWKIYSYNDIKRFLDENCKNCDNLILKQYIDHFNKIYSQLTNCEVPHVNTGDEPDAYHDNPYLAWYSFFNTTLRAAIINRHCTYVYLKPKKELERYETVLTIGLKNIENCPVLEIRSHDLYDDHFVAKMVMAKTSDEDKKKIKAIKDSIKKNPKSCFKTGKYYEIAISEKEYKNNNDFISNTHNCIREYVKLIKPWCRKKK